MTAPTKRKSLPVLASSPAGAPAPRPAPAGVSTNLRVGIITLGCDKNTVDTERLLGSLTAAGVHVGPLADADIVIVNTCGFIDRAKEESVETILDAVRLKQSGKLRAVVAMGCLVQRYKDELTTEIPEVDLFLGLSQADQLVPELRALGLVAPADDFVPTMAAAARAELVDSAHVVPEDF